MKKVTIFVGSTKSIFNDSFAAYKETSIHNKEKSFLVFFSSTKSKYVTDSTILNTVSVFVSSTKSDLTISLASQN